jgi:hypothetical protein
VVGLYLNPPENALVLCADEKSRCQALEHTQPMLPPGLGYIEGSTHGYKRHGTTTLCAALDVLNGKVVTECKPRYRHRELMAILRRIDPSVPVYGRVCAVATCPRRRQSTASRYSGSRLNP